MTRKCIEALVAEHKTLLRIADVLEAISNRSRENAEYDDIDVEAVMRLLRVFGDELHQAKEEDVLFPIYTAASNPSEYAAVRHMLFEHEQDRSLMSGMENSMQRSNAPQLSEYAIRLADKMRNHIFKEDNILFPSIENGLSETDDKRVMDGFETFDENFRHQHRDLMEILRRLEWKYMRKIA